MSATAAREPDGTVVINPLHICRTAQERMRGLLGRDAIGDAEGMWFPRCRLIHTFGMRFPIDLVYLNRSHKVRKVVEGLRPRRLSTCPLAQSVIELKSGAARRLGLRRGVKLSIIEQ